MCQLSGNLGALNFLEASGPLQACTWTAWLCFTALAALWTFHRISNQERLVKKFRSVIFMAPFCLRNDTNGDLNAVASKWISVFDIYRTDFADCYKGKGQEKICLRLFL
jgi:hypothetical protein